MLYLLSNMAFNLNEAKLGQKVNVRPIWQTAHRANQGVWSVASFSAK